MSAITELNAFHIRRRQTRRPLILLAHRQVLFGSHAGFIWPTHGFYLAHTRFLFCFEFWRSCQYVHMWKYHMKIQMFCFLFKRVRTSATLDPVLGGQQSSSREATVPCQWATCSLGHHRPHHSLLSALPTSLFYATAWPLWATEFVTPDTVDLVYFLWNPGT